MKSNLLRQLIMLSKWTFWGLVIQLFFIGILYASDGAAQSPRNINEVRINLKVNRAGIQDVFAQIEAKTNYSFIYDERIINKQQKISISKNKATVYEILMDLSRESELKFKQINEVINVYKRERSSDRGVEMEGNLLQEVSITGKV